jgi:hypothetical protein
MFIRSSEEKTSLSEGAFIVLIFEKMTRKRSIAKTQNHFDKIARGQAMREKYEQKFEEELVYHRDSKMRRFCNYFVTLFNQKKIVPFS